MLVPPDINLRALFDGGVHAVIGQDSKGVAGEYLYGLAAFYQVFVLPIAILVAFRVSVVFLEFVGFVLVEKGMYDEVGSVVLVEAVDVVDLFFGLNFFVLVDALVKVELLTDELSYVIYMRCPLAIH